MTDGSEITGQGNRRPRPRRRPGSGRTEAEATATETPPPEPAAKVPKRVLVTCPECGARFRTAVAAARRTTECMACSAGVPVPGREDLLRAAAESSTDDDAVNTAANPAPARRTRRTRNRIDVWAAFTDGVFLFPVQEGVFSRWFLLSFGCCVAGIATVMMMIVAAMGLYSALFALRMAWGWSCILTFGYAAACCLPIVAETAVGSDRVEGWPEPYWKDWALDLFRVAVPSLMVAGAAYGIARLFALGTGHFWLPLFLSIYVLSPIVLLSSLHADSMLVPITPAILESLGKCWSAWLMFYATVAVVSIAWPGLLVLGFGFNPWMTVIATAPLMSAAILIYARLLGRLGWIVTQTLTGSTR